MRPEKRYIALLLCVYECRKKENVRPHDAHTRSYIHPENFKNFPHDAPRPLTSLRSAVFFFGNKGDAQITPRLLHQRTTISEAPQQGFQLCCGWMPIGTPTSTPNGLNKTVLSSRARSQKISTQASLNSIPFQPVRQ